MDHEIVSNGNYRYDSGRSLVRAPEGQPLKELLSDFSQNVLQTLDEKGLAVVGGESGLGKSELFLGVRPEYSAGGIAELLATQGRSYVFTNSSAGFEREIDTILSSDSQAKPEFVFIDESVMIDRRPDTMPSLTVRQLLEKGVKVLLVGGGDIPAPEQNQIIKEAVSHAGLEVDDSQLFEFPPIILNQTQSEQVLMQTHQRYNLTPEQAQAIIKKMEQFNVPRIFRVLTQSSRNPIDNRRQQFYHLIKNIDFQPK